MSSDRGYSSNSNLETGVLGGMNFERSNLALIRTAAPQRTFTLISTVRIIPNVRSRITGLKVTHASLQKVLSKAGEKGTGPVIGALQRGTDGVSRGVRAIRIKPGSK